MLIPIRIIFITYLISINFYAFLTVKNQKTAFENGDKCSFNDTRLYLCALFGGAITVFVTMLILRFRLSNMFLMIFLPIVSVITIYLTFLLFSCNFGFQTTTTTVDDAIRKVIMISKILHNGL